MQTLLNGCSVEPFSSYLKSLAILRLVGEQKDPDIKGVWVGGKLEIQSVLNREEIINFFMEEYSPTPIVSPWTGGSGFYQGDNMIGIDAIIKDNSARFQLYRETIKKVQGFSELSDPAISIGNLLGILNKEAENKRGNQKDKLSKLISDTEKSLSTMNNFFINIDLHNDAIIRAKEQITDLNKSDQTPELKNARKEFFKQLKLANTEYNKLNRTNGKTAIIRACRNRLDQAVVEWIDAAVLIDAKGEQKFRQYSEVVG
ncbi:hypothetical protein B1A_02204, partial [mine drainage metagenome]